MQHCMGSPKKFCKQQCRIGVPGPVQQPQEGEQLEAGVLPGHVLWDPQGFESTQFNCHEHMPKDKDGKAKYTADEWAKKCQQLSCGRHMMTECMSWCKSAGKCTMVDNDESQLAWSPSHPYPYCAAGLAPMMCPTLKGR